MGYPNAQSNPGAATPVWIAPAPFVPDAPVVPYYPAPASAATVLGDGGKLGDTLVGFNIIPLTLAPGEVTLTDGDGTPQTFFAGGAVGSLISWFVPIGANSQVGAWTITCGDNVEVFAIGSFTK